MRLHLVGLSWEDRDKLYSSNKNSLCILLRVYFLFNCTLYNTFIMDYKTKLYFLILSYRST